MKIKSLIIFIMILNFNFTVLCQDKISKDLTDDRLLDLDINTAVDLASKNNLGIESERLKMDQKKWAAVTSWNIFVPTTSLTATMSRLNNNTSTTTTGTKSGTTTAPEWGAGFSFSTQLTLNAQMAFNIYAAILDYKNGKISFDMAQKKLVLNVKKSYYNLIIMQNKIQLTKDDIDSAKKRYERALNSYNNGQLTEYDMLATRVLFENMKPTLTDQQNTYDEALLSFSHLLGLKDDVKMNLTEKIDLSRKQFSADELIDKYLDNRLDIQSVNLSKMILENSRNISISVLSPSLIFGYTMDPSFQYDLEKPDTWSDDPNKNWKQGKGALTFALSLPVGSWFPFSKEQMGIVNATYNIKQADLNLKQAKQNAELEIKSTVLQLNKSIKSMDSLNLNIQLADKAYRLSEEAYKAGKKDLLDVESSEDELKKAQLALLEEQINYISSFLDLQYQTNNDLK
jgi:outer membrane protein TolC